MRTIKCAAKWMAIAALAWLAGTGCESTDGGSYSSASVYYGVGFYDPWYYGHHHHDDIDISIEPPDTPSKPPGGSTPPPRPTHPIAPTPSPRPTPTPMPSIPRTPMPRARAR